MTIQEYIKRTKGRGKNPDEKRVSSIEKYMDRHNPDESGSALKSEKKGRETTWPQTSETTE